jgi:hypothetical protein
MRGAKFTYAYIYTSAPNFLRLKEFSAELKTWPLSRDLHIVTSTAVVMQ